ncbi:MAG TPA: hypothetical protein VIS49_14060 [Cyclobacteriaceae bacterium]
MIKIPVAFIIGLVAGAIDKVTMVRPKMHKASIQYVFAQWVFAGLLLPFVNWNLQPWIKGLLVAERGMVPLALLAHGRTKKVTNSHFSICSNPWGGYWNS